MDSHSERLLVQRYLAFKSPKRVPAGVCPHCRRGMNRSDDFGTRKSRDHILPRVWGGRDTMWKADDGSFSRNVRVMCAQCNSRRGQLGHCIGALACLYAVCRDDLIDFYSLYRKWGMGKITVRNPKRGKTDVPDT